MRIFYLHAGYPVVVGSKEGEPSVVVLENLEGSRCQTRVSALFDVHHKRGLNEKKKI